MVVNCEVESWAIEILRFSRANARGAFVLNNQMTFNYPICIYSVFSFLLFLFVDGVDNKIDTISGRVKPSEVISALNVMMI